MDAMARLSISEEQSSSPNLTSRTPPPPGFADTAPPNGSSSDIARSDTPNTCKSTSFNNLAMALGTGLAECMDDSTSDNNNKAPPQNIPRTFTPDNYTRQSRHSVSRLMGQAPAGGGGSGGFDYLNPSGTGHLLIPPANSAYLDKLKEQHQGIQGQHLQQQQQAGRTNATSSSAVLENGRGNNGDIDPHLFSSSQQQQQQQQQQGNIGAHQVMPSAQEQKPMRFTAAMMANAQTSGGGAGAAASDATTAFQLMTNAGTNNAGGSGQQLQPSGSNGISPILSSSTNNSHQLNQELLRQQLQQQSNGMTNGLQQQQQQNNMTLLGRSNSLGVTVVEPSSTRNSPAPQRPGGGGAGSGATMIGMNGDGLLYPLVQQKQQQQQQQGGSGANNINGGIGGNINFASGGPVVSASGRASAPPPQSQPAVSGTFVPPGGMTTMVMNNAAIRAYTASSLQMRVAELHQELGGGSNNPNNQVGMAATGAPGTVQVATHAAGPGGTVTLRTIPAGAVPIVLTQAPTPPPPGRATPVIVGTPSRGLEQPQQRAPSCEPASAVVDISSSTPVSTLTGSGTPNPAIGVLQQQQPQQMPTQVGVLPQQPPQHGGGGGIAAIDPERQERERSAAQDLAPFLREPSSTNTSSASNSSASRGLAILYASTLHVPDVRSTCEAFGSLESFRSDFGEARGVFFATFYDLRSAQLAVVELPEVLNKNNGSSNSGGSRVQVKYCVPLNSSSATDESMLMLRNLPGTVDEQDLNHVLSSFGEIRAIHYQANMSEDDEEGSELSSYLVEFYDVQDARQALLELEQTNPWGDKAKVKVGSRSPTKRKQGKDLIMLMSRWRQGVNTGQSSKGETNPSSQQQPSQLQQQQGDSIANTVSPTPSPSPTQQPPNAANQQQLQQQETMSSSQTTRTSHVNHHQQTMQQQMEINQNAAAPQSYYQQYPNHQAQQQLQQYQLTVGPDGQYQYVLVNHPSPVAHHQQHMMHQYGHLGQMMIDPQQQQQQHIMYATVDQHYQMHNPHHQHMVAGQQYHIQYNGASMQQVGANNYGMQVVDNSVPTQFIRMPSGDINSSSLSSGSHSGQNRMKSSTRTSQTGKSSGSIGSGSSGNNSGGANTAGGDQDDNNNLLLSIENVRNGKDHRTSLMVRNIPNKYTQQMLLSEFASAGHGPTKMDFFYLPIDFKNKCNRGYAFVNFVDCRDIVAFFDEYNGTSWKRFNSDKICDITYARIQGKAAMLKRFENSSLMEKDDEYRPKVFVSHGERKGEPEIMPGMNNMTMGGSSLYRAAGMQ